MKPLSASRKEFLYREMAYGRFRWIAKPVYDALLGLELLWHRIEDLFHPKDQADVSSLTAIIKTFERPYAVKRLVRSMQRRYPQLKIIVVDDSEEPVSLQGVEMLRMPYNTGISAGRNAALDITGTPYFLLLDDDFVFSHRQKLGELIQYMQDHPEVDIFGGRCIDLPLYIKHEFHDMPLFSHESQPVIKPGTQIGGYGVVNKVQNFFIAKTDTVRELKWKPELKVQEHTEFFTRACGQLVTVYNPDMLVLHAKTPFDIKYHQFRFARH